jgi:hypothetical protein
MWFAIAAAWGLAEATLFFIVPDVLLTWLAGFRPRLVWRAVAACLGGALLGGLLMYLAAADSPERMRALLDLVPAISADFIAATGVTLQEQYGSQMLRAGFSGVPYKILAVESAVQGQSLATFLGWSVPARLSRWILVVLLARGVTMVVRARFAAADRVLWALWGVGWGIVYVVYFTLMGW